MSRGFVPPGQWAIDAEPDARALIFGGRYTREARRALFAETRKTMKLDKVHEASELACERARLLEFRDDIGKPGTKIKVHASGLRDAHWVRETLDYLTGGTWNIEIDLDEHARIVASLRTEIDNRLAGINEKLRALGVEIEDAPART